MNGDVNLQIASARMLPWARANLNPTAQALIISTGIYITFISRIKHFFNKWTLLFLPFIDLFVSKIYQHFIVYLQMIVAGAAYFIVADKTVLKSARQNSFNQDGKHTIKP